MRRMFIAIRVFFAALFHGQNAARVDEILKKWGLPPPTAVVELPREVTWGLPRLSGRRRLSLVGAKGTVPLSNVDGKVVVAVAALALLGWRPLAADAAQPQERSAAAGRTGLATQYPGDAGIDRDPAVLVAENFEKGTIRDLGRRWQEVSDKDGAVLAFSDDVADSSSGKRSLQTTP